MTKNLSIGALIVGVLGISLGLWGADGDGLVMAGAILVAAGIIAAAIIEGRGPN